MDKETTQLLTILETQAKYYASLSIAKSREICPLEETEQKIVMSWAKKRGLNIVASANGIGKLGHKSKRKSKVLGVVSGEPDLKLAHKIVGHIYIELKRRDRRLSKVGEAQELAITTYNTIPYTRAKICYGAAEAIKFIINVVGDKL